MVLSQLAFPLDGGREAPRVAQRLRFFEELPHEPLSDLHDSCILCGDALRALRLLPDGLSRCCVTSPPYWSLRDYQVPDQIGYEDDLDAYLDRLVEVFREVRRVLAADGVLWLNVGDAYTSGGRTYRAPDRKTDNGAVVRGLSFRPPTPAGLKPKDLIGIPWRLAFRLQQDGWYLRADVIWHKPNCIPESVKDRPTCAHEYVFLFSKSERYFYDYQAVMEARDDGRGRRNLRSVWSIPTRPFPGAHFATFPPELVVPCISAGSRIGDYVLDPFLGSGTVGLVAHRLGRRFIGIELNPEYARMAESRIQGDAPAGDQHRRGAG